MSSTRRLGPELQFDGLADPARRELAARNLLPSAGPFAEYRKTSTILAHRMAGPFEVLTDAGLMQGQAGDYLAIGVAGEMYPIAADVFDQSYEPVAP